VKTEKGSVTYLNSGDWIENLTCLEYNEGFWEIYHYKETTVTKTEVIALKHKNEIPVINVLTDEVSLFFKSIYAAR
jgi:hypothetical protein